MNRRERAARREISLDTALLIAWAIFAIVILFR